jgi:hypothetical protein
MKKWFFFEIFAVLSWCSTFNLAYANNNAFITFEETLPVPNNIRSQYCNTATTNKGVCFMESGGRIIVPSTTTASPNHALTNDFEGQFGEFDAIDVLTIMFTTEQSFVEIKVGLDRSYPDEVTAELTAYSSAIPSSQAKIKSNTVNIGKGPSEITLPLKVYSNLKNISSVTIRFYIPATGAEVHETIDDLKFSDIGPLCLASPDIKKPIVKIFKPTANSDLNAPTTFLSFEAEDAETGVASIKVSLLDATNSELDSYFVCGEIGAPKCIYEQPPTKASYGFFTNLIEGTTAIKLEARDFAGNLGIAKKSFTLTLPEPTMNLWLQAMEITQGIQPWIAVNNQIRSQHSAPPLYACPNPPSGVPLVAGRNTIVRVYPGVENVSVPVAKVTSILKCFTDPSFQTPCAGPIGIIPEHQPDNFEKFVTVNPTDSLDSKRRDRQLSFNFILPKEWTKKGKIFLEAEIFSAPYIPECIGCDDFANRMRFAYVDFQSVPNFQKDLVLILTIERYVNGQPPMKAPTVKEINDAIEFAGKVLPIDETTLPAGSQLTMRFDDDLTIQTDPNNPSPRCDALIGEIASKFQKHLSKKKAVFAFVDSSIPCNGKGGGGISYAKGDKLSRASHEIGHAVGLLHAGPPPGYNRGAECEDNTCDTDWPYGRGQIGAFGMDTITLEIIPEDRIQCHTPGICDNGINEDGDADSGGTPIVDEECVLEPDPDPPLDPTNDPHDFMSYGCGKMWTSPRTWIRMFNAFTGKKLPYPKHQPIGINTIEHSLKESEIVQTSTPQRYLFIRGNFDQNTGWTLLPIYDLYLPVKIEPKEGEYSIEVRDANDQIAAVHSFSIEKLYIDDWDEFNALSTILSFSQLIPISNDVNTVFFRKEGKLLAKRVRSLAKPAILLSTSFLDHFDFSSNPFVVKWQGRDADSKILHYSIQYTNDAKVSQSQEWQTLGLDLTVNNYTINPDNLPGGDNARIRVIVTDGFNTSVQVSPKFIVPNKPPKVHILAPKKGSSFIKGNRVVMRAVASDLEDGSLSDNNLKWYSNIDGLLGSGHRIEVDSLSPGIHIINLMGRDQSGKIGSESTELEILTLPNSQPKADAGPDQRVSVSTFLNLDGSKSSDIDGDKLSFHWSLLHKTSKTMCRIIDTETPNARFIAFDTGIYELQLIVDDGKVTSFPDRLIIEVPN